MTTTQVFEYSPGASAVEPPESSVTGVSHDRDDPMQGEPMRINVGPQHPATHGVLRLMVTLDGETMEEIVPDVGYLHRGKEKTCESLGWHKFFPHTDRLDYVQPLMNNIGYALACEKLAGLAVPERGQIIRVLLMELSRIAAHLIYIGTTGILDAYTGHRMNNTYVRIGGVYSDVDEEVEGMIRDFVAHFPAKLAELERLLTGNRIWYDRNHRVGLLTKEQAMAWSLTGPNLRGSGVEFDLRKAQPYSGYESYEFDIAVGTIGDCYDRYLVRMEEMRQSTRICAQALQRLEQTRGGEVLAEDRRYVLPPKGDVMRSMEELIFQFKVVTDLRLPRGEAYHGIESSKGELGFYVRSDGTSSPLRCHIRAPGLMNVQAIPLVAKGRLLSDMVACIGSLDFVMGEVDR
jgi:NADH-quinone oxidoreductase subunit D